MKMSDMNVKETRSSYFFLLLYIVDRKILTINQKLKSKVMCYTGKIPVISLLNAYGSTPIRIN